MTKLVRLVLYEPFDPNNETHRFLMDGHIPRPAVGDAIIVEIVETKASDLFTASGAVSANGKDILRRLVESGDSVMRCLTV